MEAVIDDEPLRQRFEQLQRAFAQASAVPTAEVEERHYLFGGRLVRMQVAGRRLAAHISRPFFHLRTRPPGGQAPRLDIMLWDENETGVYAGDSSLLAQPPETDYTDVAASGRFVQQQTRHTLVSLDRRQGVIVGAVAWTDDIGVYHRGKPLARLLAEWYADEGVPIVHAGLVACGSDGVLLAGKGGSGKSTLALACARAGLGFLGEDYAALQFDGDGAIVGHSAYGSIFLAPSTCGWFPELTPHVVDSHDNVESKSVVLLTDVWPSRLRQSVAVRAVALCRIADVPGCAVRVASRAEALLAVAPSSLLQIHGRRWNSLDYIARLIERIPCFWFDVGPDLVAAPQCIAELIGRAAAAGAES